MKTIKKIVGRWRAVALLACAACFQVRAEVTSLPMFLWPAPRMLPAEYIAQRLVYPYQSPFTPYTPYPLLDFVPSNPGTGYKPAIKTPAQFSNEGYSTWQRDAERFKWWLFFDPAHPNDASIGYGSSEKEFDIYQGVRIMSGMNIGVPPFTVSALDTGWNYTNKWDDRWINGQGESTTGDKISHPSGYAASEYSYWWSDWMLSNWGNSTQPNSEVIVKWPVQVWTRGVYRLQTTWAYWTPWRPMVVPRGASIEITPRWGQDIPDTLSYEFTNPPYLDLDIRSLAINNSSLPDWVEGRGSSYGLSSLTRPTNVVTKSVVMETPSTRSVAKLKLAQLRANPPAFPRDLYHPDSVAPEQREAAQAKIDEFGKRLMAWRAQVREQEEKSGDGLTPEQLAFRDRIQEVYDPQTKTYNLQKLPPEDQQRIQQNIRRSQEEPYVRVADANSKRLFVGRSEDEVEAIHRAALGVAEEVVHFAALMHRAPVAQNGVEPLKDRLTPIKISDAEAVALLERLMTKVAKPTVVEGSRGATSMK